MIGPTRVCARVRPGLLLQAQSAAAPGPGDAFVVADDSLSVCAVSAAAEQLLATLETDAINQPITRLLVPADAEGNGANLATAITWAARGDGAVHRAVVRPANTFGIRITARIAACGPRSRPRCSCSNSPIAALGRGCTSPCVCCAGVRGAR